MGLLFIFIIFVVASLVVSNRLKSKFRKYSKIPTSGGFSGKEVAEKMLYENGIYNVQITSVPGKLTDHYNPVTRTINLSPDVYHGRNIAAAAVAAHETGHAVQHARSYFFLQVRSALVPLQNVSARLINIIFTFLFFGAFLLPGLLPINTAFFILALCYGVLTLFAFITLPVEIDASRRALAWLNTSGVTNSISHPKAVDALRWAAYTYVVAALSSLAMLLFYVMQFLGRSD